MCIFIYIYIYIYVYIYRERERERERDRASARERERGERERELYIYIYSIQYTILYSIRYSMPGIRGLAASQQKQEGQTKVPCETSVFFLESLLGSGAPNAPSHFCLGEVSFGLQDLMPKKGLLRLFDGVPCNYSLESSLRLTCLACFNLYPLIPSHSNLLTALTSASDMVTTHEGALIHETITSINKTTALGGPPHSCSLRCF